MNLGKATEYIYPSMVLDIGANVGHWYREAKQDWSTAEFFLIEGNDECAPALAELGVPFEIAVLSDTEKDVDFFTMKDCGTATGCSYYRENTPFFEGDKAIAHKVRTRTLDGLIDRAGVVKAGDNLLIKIDCQGAELDILRGGQQTIGAAKALILELALTNYNQGAPLIQEVVEYVWRCGFQEKAHLETIGHPTNPSDIIQVTKLFMR